MRLTKLKGCGKKFWLPRYAIYRGGMNKYCTQKPGEFVAVLDMPQGSNRACGDYCKPTWWRRTRVYLCEACLVKQGLIW